MERSPVPAHLRGGNTTVKTASESQLNWAKKLRMDKDLTGLSQEQVGWLIQADFDTFPSPLPMHRLSQVIEALVALPWKKRTQAQTTQPGEPKVPFGRYAVEKDDGTLMFYSVKYDWETKGQKVYVWASSEQWLINNPGEKLRVLKLIAADPRAAMNRFGMEIGRCGRCGRVLTRKSSRDLGLGPDCAKKMSW